MSRELGPSVVAAVPKVDPETGLVRPAHGVSVFDNPASVTTKGFTPHRIDQSASRTSCISFSADRIRITSRSCQVDEPLNRNPGGIGAAMSATEAQIADRYRDLTMEWAALRDHPKKANRVFRRHHAYYKEIRDLPEGRRALRDLMTDPEAPVRLLAATHSLRFAPAEAQAALMELENSEGICAVDAKFALMNFRAGRLDLDW